MLMIDQSSEASWKGCETGEDLNGLYVRGDDDILFCVFSMGRASTRGARFSVRIPACWTLSL